MNKEIWTLDRVYKELDGPAPLRLVMNRKTEDGRSSFAEPCQEYPWSRLGKIIIHFTKNNDEKEAARVWPHVAEAIQIYKSDCERTSRREINIEPADIIRTYERIAKFSGKLSQEIGYSDEFMDVTPDLRSPMRSVILKELNAHLWNVTAHYKAVALDKNEQTNWPMDRETLNNPDYMQAGQHALVEMYYLLTSLRKAGAYLAEQSKARRKEISRKTSSFNEAGYRLMQPFTQIWTHITCGGKPTASKGKPDAPLFTNFVTELLENSGTETLTVKVIGGLLEKKNERKEKDNEKA